MNNKTLETELRDRGYERMSYRAFAHVKGGIEEWWNEKKGETVFVQDHPGGSSELLVPCDPAEYFKSSLATSALQGVMSIIERTYDHDETGKRVPDAPGNYSGADVVEALCNMETEIEDALEALGGD